MIGHGTGSTRQLFEQAATGNKEVATGQVIANPHNQTLSVAIQWGTVGIVILYATWLCHLLLFRDVCGRGRRGRRDGAAREGCRGGPGAVACRPAMIAGMPA